MLVSTTVINVVVSACKKKLKNFEEQFEAENGYRVSLFQFSTVRILSLLTSRRNTGYNIYFILFKDVLNIHGILELLMVKNNTTFDDEVKEKFTLWVKVVWSTTTRCIKTNAR